MSERVRWTCPTCQRRFSIPAGRVPEKCPECVRNGEDASPSEDSAGSSERSTTETEPAVRFAEVEDEVATPPIELNRTRPRRRSRGAIGLFELLDLKFERYLTPWILRFTWSAALIVFVIALAGRATASVASVFDDSTAQLPAAEQEPQRRIAMDFGPLNEHLPSLRDSAGRVLQFLLQIVAAVFALLYLRVVCELFIVVFNISATLTRMERGGTVVIDRRDDRRP